MTSALRHMQKIALARTPDELWQHLADALRDYGFDRVTYGATRTMRGGSLGELQDAVFLSNHGDGPLADLFDMGFFIRTPMFRWALYNAGACSWRWAEDERLAGRLSAEELAAMAMARKAGLMAGYTISFTDPSPRVRAAMALCLAPGLTQDDADSIWNDKGAEIWAVCQMMHLRLQGMPFPVRRRPLSPRQREALEWVAEGKTTQDIAIIMGISAAMVEKHLRLAREVLDVETTAHAVAKAALFNHIFSGNGPSDADESDR